MWCRFNTFSPAESTVLDLLKLNEELDIGDSLGDHLLDSLKSLGQFGDLV